LEKSFRTILVDIGRPFDDSPGKTFDACFVLRVTTLKLPIARDVLIISVAVVKLSVDENYKLLVRWMSSIVC
jgi:hypothetical protein